MILSTQINNKKGCFRAKHARLVDTIHHIKDVGVSAVFCLRFADSAQKTKIFCPKSLHALSYPLLVQCNPGDRFKA